MSRTRTRLGVRTFYVHVCGARDSVFVLHTRREERGGGARRAWFLFSLVSFHPRGGVRDDRSGSGGA